jgi:hypothetical protein
MTLSPEKRELAKEARDTRENPAFKTALEKARQRRLDDLMSEATSATERKLELIAELRAFQAVEQELKSIADDLIMERRHA